jgi:hypothetical protein
LTGLDSIRGLDDTAKSGKLARPESEEKISCPRTAIVSDLGRVELTPGT